jgi:hypothetical protein
MTRWYAQIDGMAPSEIPYARLSSFIQATPRAQRRRLADGSLVIGYWRFWRAVSP